MEEKQRTLQQNKALHKYFEILSTDLNTLGLDARVILKPTYNIWWNPDMVKRDLFHPLCKAMFNKESTKDLTTAEVDKVYEQLSHMLGEKWGVEVSFPSEDSEAFISITD